MKPKAFLLAACILIALTVSGIIFIHFTNDHAECETVTDYTVTPKGEKITTTKHICRERFAI